MNATRGTRLSMLALSSALIGAVLSTGGASAAVDNHLTLVSIGTAGVQPNGGSAAQAISADGRYVAFLSAATNLGPVATSDTNANVYLRDNQTGAITLISHKPNGTANGRAVPLVSISGDGRYVVYPLRVGLNTVGMRLVMWDRVTDTTTTVSKTPAGDLISAPAFESAMSTDGSTIVYQIQLSQRDAGDDLTHTRLYVYDVASDTTEQIGGGDIVYPQFNTSGHPAVSGDGTFVAYAKVGPDNTAGLQHTMLVRLNTVTGAQRTVYRSALTINNAVRDPSFDASGRILAFTHTVDETTDPAANPSVVSTYDASSGQLAVVSRAVGGGDANGPSGAPDVSGNGRYVAFQSTARNLIDEPSSPVGKNGVYLYDRQTGSMQRLDLNRQGVYPRGDAMLPSVNADGSAVVFQSDAGSLTAGATTTLSRVFLWSRPAG